MTPNNTSPSSPQNTANALALIAGVALLAVSFSQNSKISRLDKNLEIERASGEKLQKIVDVVEQYESQAALIRSEILKVEGWRESTRLYPDFLKDFSHALPKDAVLESFNALIDEEFRIEVTAAVSYPAGRPAPDWRGNVSKRFRNWSVKETGPGKFTIIALYDK